MCNGVGGWKPTSGWSAPEPSCDDKSSGGWSGGDDFKLPSESKTEEVAKEIGGADGKFGRSDAIAFAESKGVKENVAMTDKQFTDVVEGFGFEKDAAQELLGAAKKEYKNGITGEKLIDDILNAYVGDDKEMDAKELGQSNKDLGKMAGITEQASGGWA